jgi:hypothetical protein
VCEPVESATVERTLALCGILRSPGRRYKHTLTQRVLQSSPAAACVKDVCRKDVGRKDVGRKDVGRKDVGRTSVGRTSTGSTDAGTAPTWPTPPGHSLSPTEITAGRDVSQHQLLPANVGLLAADPVSAPPRIDYALAAPASNQHRINEPETTLAVSQPGPASGQRCISDAETALVAGQPRPASGQRRSGNNTAC